MATPVKKVVVKKKPVPGTPAVDDVVRIARARAQATLAAAGKPIRSVGNAQATQQVNAAAGLASAFAPIAKQVQDIYGGAGRDTAALAQGYSSDLRDRLMAAGQNNDALIAAQGLPVAPGGPAAADAAANVLYGTGGALPAASLQAQGAGFGAAAALLPATARLQGAAQALQTRQQMQKDLADLQAKYPDVFQQYLTDERNWKNAQFDNYVNYLNSQGGYGGSSSARVRTYVGKDGTTYAIDPTTGTYVPTGQVSVPPGTSAAGKARVKAVQKRDDDTVKQVQKVTEWLNKALSGKPIKTGSKTISVGGISKTTPIYKPASKPTYRVAYNYMFNQLWLALKRYGYTKADIRQMTQQILDAHNLNPQKAGPPNPGAPADSPVGG